MKITGGMGSPGEAVHVTTDRKKITISFVQPTGDFVVADDQVALPGVFSSRSAALIFATMLTPDQQERLGSRCKDGETIIGLESVFVVLEGAMEP